MAAVAASSGEILVFTDANTTYDAAAIRGLVAHFADPEVGGVAGNQVYFPAGHPAASSTRPATTTDDAVGERGYWDLDRRLKVAQGASDSVVGATGAIYAIRRDLFTPIPYGVADDLSVTLGVLASGARFVFAPEAVAYEPVAPTHGAEFARKVRVVTRGLQAVIAWRTLLDPRRHGFLALVVLSRKVLMRTMALPLAALLVSSLVLARRSTLYRLAAAPQLAAYALAVVGLAAPGTRLGRHRIAAIPAFVVMAQAASLVGLWNVVRGRRGEGWQTARQLPVDESQATVPHAEESAA
jgi:cellulose synthase/poly-beta-1,6-N-acetylglucosamine synthase-like glycosyltransferase